MTAVSEQTITLDIKPPSVNRYRNFNSKTGRWYVSAEGAAFKEALGWMVRLSGPTVLDGMTDAEMQKSRYCVEVWVYLGRGAKGDGDNMWKAILDGLRDAGAIHSDTGTAVVDSYMHVREARDQDFTRTIITVRLLERRTMGAAPVQVPELRPIVTNDGGLLRRG